jgi:hypothetical protein
MHADPSEDCKAVSEREAERAILEGRAVFAPEARDGALGRVTGVNPLTIEGLLTPAISIRFASGHGRVCEGEAVFYVCRSSNG